MSNQKRFINADRRRFIRNSTVVGGAAAAGVAVGTTQAGQVEHAAPVSIESTDRHARYKKTERVQEYYDKARF